MATRIVVYPLTEGGGRRVRANGEILGRARSLGELLEFLRRPAAGLQDATAVQALGERMENFTAHAAGRGLGTVSPLALEP
ncbi:hypothetical protein [Streptomyces johnsoniae]|uniref:Uncharacterized protein n=1 Tax=Streptomyces johnsoniae TaxID=3075532 RepID=A0ABU2S0X9_9ACTN|nr:hypothetical protein [Streptomyces sp. DSM 41886]MDT0441225.1 hypothetical protein [Streptomyces sp. DSM 41886]